MSNGVRILLALIVMTGSGSALAGGGSYADVGVGYGSGYSAGYGFSFGYRHKYRSHGYSGRYYGGYKSDYGYRHRHRYGPSYGSGYGYGWKHDYRTNSYHGYSNRPHYGYPGYSHGTVVVINPPVYRNYTYTNRYYYRDKDLYYKGSSPVYRPATEPRPRVKLLKDRNGDCFEVRNNSRGEEIHIFQDPSRCDL